MKTIIAIFLTFTLSGQVLTVKDLPALLEKSKTDSVLKIERLAAMKFHKLINEYRVKNGKKALRWNDTLWLAARNHDLWMHSSDLIGHGENKNTKNFTGENMTNRINYVCKKSGFHFEGENAYGGAEAKGKTVKEIADCMASDAFKTWRESEGHNENMLYTYTYHAVAFILTKSPYFFSEYWGTDLFAKQ